MRGRGHGVDLLLDALDRARSRHLDDAAVEQHLEVPVNRRLGHVGQPVGDLMRGQRVPAERQQDL